MTINFKENDGRPDKPKLLRDAFEQTLVELAEDHPVKDRNVESLLSDVQVGVKQLMSKRKWRLGIPDWVLNEFQFRTSPAREGSDITPITDEFEERMRKARSGLTANHKQVQATGGAPPWDKTLAEEIRAMPLTVAAKLEKDPAFAAIFAEYKRAKSDADQKKLLAERMFRMI